MAHHIKIKAVPHINKDGTESSTKKDYVVTDRHRGKKTVVGVFPSRKIAEEEVARHHHHVKVLHLMTQPNDKDFQRKNGLTEKEN